MELSQERLKELFSYDGKNLICRVSTSSRVKIGSIAGSYSQRYQRVMIDGKSYLAHRLVWLYYYGQWPKTQLDHVNGDARDNRIKNLREVTTQENLRNCGIASNNTSSVKGVSYDYKSQKWVAYIFVHRRKKYLGGYHTLADAAKARYNEEVRLDWLGYDSLTNMGSAYSYLKKNHLI